MTGEHPAATPTGTPEETTAPPPPAAPPPNTGPPETTPPATGPRDTTPPATGSSGTGPPTSGLRNTGPPASGPPDAGSSGTGPSGAGSSGAGAVGAGAGFDEVRVLIRAQLRIALGTCAIVMTVLAGLPVLLAAVPAAAAARMHGVPLWWLILALGVQPLWIAVARRQLLHAERAERDLVRPVGPP